MTKRGRKSETLNLFEQYGGKHHQPDRLILFDDDSRNGPWLDALDAFDLGDKSELVALLKSGYPIPPAIAPHTGRIADAAKGAGYRVITADIVDRGYPGCRIQDFLKRRSAPPSVVGNPPFAIVEEFARHAFDIGADKVALIARTASIHAARWLRELPFSHAWLMTAIEMERKMTKMKMTAAEFYRLAQAQTLIDLHANRIRQLSFSSLSFFS